MNSIIASQEENCWPLCVAVVGLGYVGLPLAIECAKRGITTIGVDVSGSKVESLSRGSSDIKDISEQELKKALSASLKVTVDFKLISNADVVVLCVPTPLSESGNPALEFVINATRSITPHLKSGALVILESTSYPGTTEEVVRPIIDGSNRELDNDFFLAFSPERIDPGNSHFNIRNTPRVVGGASTLSAERAQAFYKKIVEQVVVLSGTREAEMAKLIENTYRHVNIALVNELAVVCHELGINIWEAIRGASTKPFGYEKFIPSAGVGGHCIPIDPIYLDNLVKEKLGRRLEIVGIAQKINESMPDYVASRVLDILSGEQETGQGRILLLGATYKADSEDTRETPARDLAKALMNMGFEVSFHDPHLNTFLLDDGTPLAYESDWKGSIAQYSLAILLQPHKEYLQKIDNHLGENVLDCTGRFSDFVDFVL